jgi:hypothetical protein
MIDIREDAATTISWLERSIISIHINTLVQSRLSKLIMLDILPYASGSLARLFIFKKERQK